MKSSPPSPDENPFHRHGEGCFKGFTWLVILATASLVAFFLFLVNAFSR